MAEKVLESGTGVKFRLATFGFYRVLRCASIASGSPSRISHALMRRAPP